MLLEGVKVSGVNPGMMNTKLSPDSLLNHVKAVLFMYESITWHYLDAISNTPTLGTSPAKVVNGSRCIGMMAALMI
jgi:hypothetical protein